MSALESLSIKGIRSFPANPSDESKAVIQFDGPVTLITGANGAGKTTIIESLLYATTGQSKEAEFVSDPRMWDQSMTNAEVSLNFKSTTQEDMKIVRKSKSEKNRSVAGIGFKSLDSNLTTGDNKSYSCKTGQVNTEVPLLLGVSPAILENVIFCHQEDACWPIDLNSKDLKNRFDEIFGAEKYEKALNAVKKLIKDKKNDRDELEKQEGRLDVKQGQMIDLEKQQRDMLKSVNELDGSIKSAEQNVQSIKNRVNAIKEKKSAIDAIQAEISNENGALQAYLNIIKNIELQCGKEHPSRDKCESEISSSQDEISSINEKIKFYKDLKDQERKASAEIDKTHSLKNNEKRKLEENSKTFLRMQQIYDNSIKEFKEMFNTDDYITKQREVNRDITSKKAELGEKSKKMSELESKYEKEKQKLTRAREDASNRQSRIKGNLDKVKDDLDKAQKYTNDELDSLSSAFHNSQTTLIDFKNSQESPDSINKKKEELKNSINDVKMRIDQNKKQIRLLESQEELENSIRYKNLEISKNEKTKEERLDKIRSELGNESISEDNVFDIVNNRIKACDAEVQRLTFAQKKVDREFNSICDRIARKEKELRENNEKIKQYEEMFLGIIPKGSTLVDEIEKVQKLLQEVRANQTKYQKSDSIYQSFLAKAIGPECECPLCKRKFASNEERDNFVKEKLVVKIEKLPKKLENAKKSEKNLSDRLQKLESYRTDYQKYELLLSDVNSSSQKIEGDEIEKGQKQDELDNVNMELEQAKGNRSNLDADITESALLKSALNDIKREKRELEKLVSQRVSQELPNPEEARKSLHDNEEIYQHFMDENAELSEKYMNASKKISDMKLELSKAESKYKQYKEKLEAKINMENELRELEIQNAKALEDESIAYQNIKNIEDEYDPQIQEIKSEIEKLNSVIQELGKDMSVIDSRVKTLKEADKFLKENEESSLKQNLEIIEDEIIKLKNAYDECQIKIRNADKQIMKEEETREKALHIKQEMSLHIEYYKNYDEVRLREAKIADKQRQLESILPDKEALENFSKLEKMFEKESGELERMKGEYDTKQESLRTLNKSLKLFEGTPQELTEIRIKIAALKMTEKDLETYKNRLDETLIDYHSRKMKEINKIIQKLWEDTYFTHDIDTIMIKAEKSKAKNASYTYSVVMRKDGIEVSMRNRCSAGQKMLASLIIRLALAQAFSQNCGIIALDEPTTNIDLDNMINFAEQLNKLVRKRVKSGTGTFQMIIISHSQHFVNLIARGMEIDHFYQITKESDGKHHFSQIARRDSSYLSLGQ